jgi:uncharacterized protein
MLDKPSSETTPWWPRTAILRSFLAGPRRFAIALIRGYQYFLSPFFGQSCRFHPTCSSYAIEALQRFGLIRGGLLAMGRLGRCQPWCSGGVDPVPSFETRGAKRTSYDDGDNARC